METNWLNILKGFAACMGWTLVAGVVAAVFTVATGIRLPDAVCNLIGFTTGVLSTIYYLDKWPPFN